MALQGLAGNRAVAETIQAKTAVTGPNMVQRQPMPDAGGAPTGTPPVVTMMDFIALIRRLEAARPGVPAVDIARDLAATKYTGQSWQYLLPSLATAHPMVAGGGVSANDVAAVSHKLIVTMPGGGQEDALHVIVTLAAKFESLAPGSAPGAKNWAAGRVASSLPASANQQSVSGWLGDVASAAAEWQAARPIPRGGGSAKEDYANEYMPYTDLMGDIDGAAMTAATAEFTFNPNEPLSRNMERFYNPSGRQGRSRRFHLFTAAHGLALAPDGVTLAPATIASIDNKVREFAAYLWGASPGILTWIELNSPKLPAGPMGVGMPGVIPPIANPVVQQWNQRSGDWRWFSQRFQQFLQQNLSAEGP